ncbi:MAG: transcription termination/antitermination NusG family protein [Candidatus Promineifilaceae bacterium]
MSFNWYALHVKPHKERPVCELLETKEMEVFYPHLKVKPVNPRSKKERPFFPGYMFVRLDLNDEGVNVLRWTEGTYGLVSFGDEPVVVPENMINELKRRMQAIEEVGGLVFEDLKQGDRVRITKGPFEGYDAIFDARLSGKDRVQVLLAYLNDHPIRVQIDAAEIEKVRPKR